MRLTCPSCGAQYEVDESAIPESGRDVQCSNCGHAWFQVSAARLRAEAASQAAPAAPRAESPAAQEPVAEPVAETEESPALAADDEPYDAGAEAETPSSDYPTDDAGPDTAPVAADSDRETELVRAALAGTAAGEADRAPMDDTPEPTAEEAEESPAMRMAADRRRILDDAVRNVLREEAEREEIARQAEGSAAEPQPASASAAPPRIEETAERMARMRGDDDESDDEALVSRASRRELLPDIEAINSTLRATSERGDEPASIDAPETLRRRRSGFRLGFSTALLAALLLLSLYVAAPPLAKSVPALEPALTGYVTSVDSARVWLDTRIRSLTESLKGKTEGS
ncbi:zinc-ribbon domain-containing protein [Defluviimonas salinarum]|uniref:Zinc-ribbon domain-containing protein n=1 Tax=Defluviimonas salinarum TaxID=2992147 RepID=A0ABT3JAS2_9RHOB|nr:zinc-ribbon domain-containing protein [Defluviimonas salinarum]MCW3784540.1 zinc-ribbon domain-containing protein [Defluviimonas salinarum]